MEVLIKILQKGHRYFVAIGQEAIIRDLTTLLQARIAQSYRRQTLKTKPE